MRNTRLDVVTVPDNPTHMPWKGHASLIEVVFDALPSEVKGNLNKDKMKESSNDPDEIFKDTVNHHYPASYEKATEWLGKAKDSYSAGDFDGASHCFGVASHYISDTFMAPHCVSREKSRDHHDFEVLTNEMTPIITTLQGDLESMMIEGVKQGKEDWHKWKNNKDNSIVQKELDMAGSAAYTAILNSL